MLLSESKKFIFIHNPRCAGTTCTSVLSPFSLTRDQVPIPDVDTHIPLKYIAKHIKIKKYMVFGFVRNPWDVTHSYYQYLLTAENPGPEVLEFQQNPPDFEQFVLGTVRSSIMDYYFKVKKDYPVSFIGKYENFDLEFRAILEALKVDSPYIGDEPLSLPKLNSTIRLPYQNFYTDKARRHIEQCCQSEITTFGYKFNEN